MTEEADQGNGENGVPVEDAGGVPEAESPTGEISTESPQGDGVRRWQGNIMRRFTEVDHPGD